MAQQKAFIAQPASVFVYACRLRQLAPFGRFQALEQRAEVRDKIWHQLVERTRMWRAWLDRSRLDGRVISALDEKSRYLSPAN